MQDKQVTRLVEEVAAGRLDSLDSATTEQLEGVLAGLGKKRNRDRKYLVEHAKATKLSMPPKAPDLTNRNAYMQAGVVCGEGFGAIGLTRSAIQAILSP